MFTVAVAVDLAPDTITININTDTKVFKITFFFFLLFLIEHKQENGNKIGKKNNEINI